MPKKPRRHHSFLHYQFNGLIPPLQSEGQDAMRDYVDDATGDYRSQVKRFVKRMVIGILSGGLVGALFGFVIAVDFGGVAVNWPMIVITGLFGGVFVAFAVWSYEAGHRR